MNNEKGYKISVALCTYNGEKYIYEQLQSIVNQTIKPDEIVISDDHSSDSTQEIVKDFIKHRKKDKMVIKLLVNDNYKGVTGNFENAAKNTTGDIVFFSDQDDVWYSNKIEDTMYAFYKYPSSVGVISDADCVDIHLNKLGVTFSEGCWKKFKELEYDNENMYNLLGKDMMDVAVRGNILGGCCLAVKNNILDKMYDFCPNIYHDDWICFCMFVLGDVVALNKSLFAYRLHGNNTVGFNNIVRNKTTFIKKIKKVRKTIRDLPNMFIDNAERCIYFNKFAYENNRQSSQLEYQWNLNKRKILAVTSKKIEGLRMLKKIAISNNQYKTKYYYLECIYLLLYSRKRRLSDLSKYLKIFKCYNTITID